ncbi:MAG TPA: gluconokinase [Bacillales bacterium]|nr:gluconokinase [Bacillales bacterium]
MNENVIIGVDIGTTSTKTMAFDESGRILSGASQEYPLFTEIPGRVEQDPDEIFQAVELTLAKVAKSVAERSGFIQGVSFSAAMHSLIAVDKNGNPLTRSITWADQRSTGEAEQLKASSVGQSVYSRTGTPIHPMSPLTKLIWFEKNEPELAASADKWISIKEYIFYKWFQEFIVDYSIASATGLFHLKNLDWDEEALDLAGITRDQLSKPVSTTYSIRGLQSAKAEQLGLPEDVPFIAGASDGVLANLGVGAIEEGSVACSIGTSGAVRTIVPEPATDPQGRIFCYVLTEDHWVIGGPINNGGIAFRWIRDNVFDELPNEAGDPYDLLTSRAERIGPGTDGLLFLPYLTGERAPYWNADTKGVFFGLTLNHNRDHMIRAVLEGVMFQMDAVVSTLKEAGVNPTEFRATGGFTKSELWCQIMADIFQTDILVPASNSSACFGAAVLAMKALGDIEDFSTVREMVHIQNRHVPIEENTYVYQTFKPVFQRLAESLQPEFTALSDLKRKLENR